jgi:drug/metabolite transporter (DMT)-like permease
MLIILGVLSTISFILMFHGTPYTTSTNQSLLNSFCAVIVVFINLVVYKKKPSNNIAFSVIITTIGVIMVLLPLNLTENDTIIGDLFTLASMIITAFYSIQNEKLMKRKPNSLFIVMATNLFTIIVLFPLIFIDNQIYVIISLSIEQWMVIIWLGISISGFGYWINTELYSGKDITAEHVMIFASLIMIFGVILGMVIYNDYLNGWNVFGVLIIIIAVYASQIKERKIKNEKKKFNRI